MECGFEIWVEVGADPDATNTVLLRAPVLPPSCSSPTSSTTAVAPVRCGVLFRRDVICFLTAEDCNVVLEDGWGYVATHPFILF